MRKIKVVSGKFAGEMKKKAVEPGDIAPVLLENFETLTQPPFKSKLDLIEADPHNPPEMSAQTDQNIDTEGDDPNRPSAQDIARKAPEYENVNSVEVEDVPHEKEHVKQGSSQEEDLGAKMAAMKQEYQQKYALAYRLFDIKLAAGLEEEFGRQNFVHSKTDNSTIDELKQQVNDAEAFLTQIEANRKTASVPKVPTIPTGFGSGQRNPQGPFEDNVDMIIMGG